VNAQSCVIAKSFTGIKWFWGAQSPNGKYILSGSDDNLAFMWDEYGKIIDTISVHKEKCKRDVTFHQTINVLLQEALKEHL
jgi:WD40 repeat protein